MAASDGRTDTRQSEDNSDFSRIENTLKTGFILGGFSKKIFQILAKFSRKLHQKKFNGLIFSD
jgi:hypothetical protein